MAQYKCVPGPGALVVKKIEQLKDAVSSYSTIIEREAVGGWVLESITPIQVTKKAGLLGKAVGLSDDNFEVNMLVFRKD